MTPTPVEKLEKLVRGLCVLPREAEWAEFKQDQADANEIGEYLSALSNAAALVGQPCGYVVWGIEDGSHKVVGTQFDPSTAKANGNEDLEGWLNRLLDPRIDFRFCKGTVDGHVVAVLEVPPASSRPVRFSGSAPTARS